VLEIYADEVKASHGATVGQLDERALFYLRSRGVPLALARNLLIAGFCREAFAGIGDAELRTRLEAMLAERLPQAGESSR
jgi:Fe-S cluster assembly protein SufD